MPLDKEENKARFIQRLRQYLELRNLIVLIGNGCSLPLGHKGSVTQQPSCQIDASPYRLTQENCQERARTLLNHLLPEKSTIGVEPLLTVLANVQANEQLLQRTTMLGGVEVPTEDARCLERLLKKWLFTNARHLATSATWICAFMKSSFVESRCQHDIARAEIFTLNYDLLLERALDNLGVLYFDGFRNHQSYAPNRVLPLRSLLSGRNNRRTG